MIPTCLQVGVMLGIDPACFKVWSEQVVLDRLEVERVDYVQIVELIELIQTMSGRTDVAFLLGEAFGFHFSPAVATYLGSLDTLRTLLTDLHLVRDFFSRQLDVRVQQVSGEVQVMLSIRNVLADLPSDSVNRLAAAGVLAFCQKLLTSLLPDQMSISAFHFRHKAPDNLEDYARYLRAPSIYGSEFDGFTVSSRWLDYPLRGAFPALNGKARLRMQSLVSLFTTPASLADKIQDAFAEHHELLYLPLNATAEYFGVSERTMQRKLQAESLTFFELQETAKKAIAATLLKQGLSTDQVAESLGFSDRRSFCRAFKRWYGETPSMFRCQMSE